MSYEIRPGEREDVSNAIPLLQEFVDESLSEYGISLTVEQAQKTAEAFVEHSLVMVFDGFIVGLIAGTMIQNFLNGERIYQEQIWFVSKKHRRHGIKLLKQLEKNLLLIGVTKMIMGYMANSMSEKLHKFYNSLGFKFMEAHFIKILKDERGFIATSTLIATAAVIGAVGAGTAGIVSAAKGSGSSGGGGSVAAPAQPQSYADIEAAEKNKLLASKQSQTKNVLTSPLGVTDPQESKKKVLLGA